LFRTFTLWSLNNTSNRFNIVNIDNRKANFSQRGFFSPVDRAAGGTAYVEVNGG